MAKRPRRNHGSVLKAKVTLEAVKGDQTVTELAECFQVHLTLIVHPSDAFFLIAFLRASFAMRHWIWQSRASVA